MLKKILYSIMLILVLIIFCTGYKIYLISVDTKYAIKFAEVLSSCNVDEYDSFFNDNTEFIYGERRVTYKQTREHIADVFKSNSNNFKINSYGHGNDEFINGIQDIQIYLSGTFNGERISDCIIYMKLKRGLFSFEVVSLECQEPIFEYLFFGD